MKNHPIYDKALSGHHLTYADIARLLRTSLKAHFPKTKFSIKSSSYSMGGSIDIEWTDGPTIKQVDSICENYRTKCFDGMDDSTHFMRIWIYPDGSATQASFAGCTNKPAFNHPPVKPGALKPESIASGYIYCQRLRSVKSLKEAIEVVKETHKETLNGFNWDNVEIVDEKYFPYLKGSESKIIKHELLNEIIYRVIGMKSYENDAFEIQAVK